MTLEQVVEALKRCTQDHSVGSCAGCPYEDVGDTFAKCCLALMFDCLDLLKAQEPPKNASISSAIECFLHPQDADDSDMKQAIDTAVLAMRLSKAQEPRVVKISELTSGEPMLVWLEDIDKEETVAGMIFDYVPGRLGFKLTDLASMDRIYPRIEDYLTRWRCWTAKPSEKRRAETPWN